MLTTECGVSFKGSYLESQHHLGHGRIITINVNVKFEANWILNVDRRLHKRNICRSCG